MIWTLLSTEGHIYLYIYIPLHINLSLVLSKILKTFAQKDSCYVFITFSNEVKKNQAKIRFICREMCLTPWSDFHLSIAFHIYMN